MATTPKRFVSGSQLTTGTATYYTAPSNTKARITQCVITNTSAGAETAKVHLVPSGGSADDTNVVFDDSVTSVAAGETKTITGAIGQVLEAGGTIQAIASAGTALTLVVSGYEIV